MTGIRLTVNRKEGRYSLEYGEWSMKWFDIVRTTKRTKCLIGRRQLESILDNCHRHSLPIRIIENGKKDIIHGIDQRVQPMLFEV